MRSRTFSAFIASRASLSLSVFDESPGGKAKLGQVTVAIDDKTYLDVRWECERLD
jgi:hypothetical protein